MRDHFTKILVVTAITFFSGHAFSGIYKYVDENGNVAYGDKPVQGAKWMNVQPGPNSQANEKQDAESLETDDDSNKEVTSYESLELLTPKNEKIVSDRSGSVQVILLPTPNLSRTHELVITVDGKDISRGRHANLNLSQVSRGTHTVTARILDANGITLISSPTSTFHVKKP